VAFLSDYAAVALVNALCRNVSFRVSNPTLSLHSGDPGETGAQAELSGNGYARAALSANPTTEADVVYASTSASITFASVPADVLVTHFAVWDGSQMIWNGQLTDMRGNPASVRSLTGFGLRVPVSYLQFSFRNALGNYLQTALLRALFSAVAFSVASRYFSLHSRNPGAHGYYELAGGTYQRQPVTFDASSGRCCVSSAQVSVTVPASEIYYWGLWDAASGGNFLLGGQIDQPVTSEAGDVVLFPAGEIAVSL